MSDSSFRDRYPEVAPLPIIDITFDVDAEGNEYALVEGMDVEPETGEDVGDAALRTVAAMVDTVAGVDENGKPYEALKARVVNDPLHRFVIVYRDGRLYVPGDTPEDVREFRTFGPDNPPVPLDIGKLPAGDLFRRELYDPADEVGRRFDTAFARDDATVGGYAPPRHAPTDEGVVADLEDRFAAHFTGGATTDAQVGPDSHVPGEAHITDGSHDPADQEKSAQLTPRHPAAGASLVDAEQASAFSNAQIPALVAPGHPVGQTFDTGLASAAERLHEPVSRTALTPPERTHGPERVTTSGRDRLDPPNLKATMSPLRKRLLIAAIAATAVVVSAGLGLALLDGNRAANVAEQPVPTVNPPPGWSERAAWATGPLVEQAGPVVTFSDRAAYVTAAGEVVVADAATGEPVWAKNIAADQVRGPLAFTRLIDTDAVAIHVGNRFLAWSADDGSPVAAADLPEQAQVTYLGPAPLVGTGPSTVAVIGSEGLVDVAVPPGAYALAAGEDRTVTAAGKDGWWHLRAGVAPGEARPFENANPDALPADVAPQVLGYLGDSIVLRYPAFRDQRAQIVVHTDTSAGVRVAFRGPAVPVSDDDVLIGSPTRTWGIHGRTLIDVKGGSVTDLGGWTTAAVMASRAVGQVSAAPAMTGPGQTPAQLPEGVDVPEAESPAGLVIRLVGPALTQNGATALAENEQGAVLVPPEG